MQIPQSKMLTINRRNWIISKKPPSIHKTFFVCKGKFFATLLNHKTWSKPSITHQGINRKCALRSFDHIQKPLFTSVKQDIDALARSALELLLRKMNGEECPLKVVVKTTFRKGDTA